MAFDGLNMAGVGDVTADVTASPLSLKNSFTAVASDINTLPKVDMRNAFAVSASFTNQGPDLDQSMGVKAYGPQDIQLDMMRVENSSMLAQIEMKPFPSSESFFGLGALCGALSEGVRELGQQAGLVQEPAPQLPVPQPTPDVQATWTPRMGGAMG